MVEDAGNVHRSKLWTSQLFLFLDRQSVVEIGVSFGSTVVGPMSPLRVWSGGYYLRNGREQYTSSRFYYGNERSWDVKWVDHEIVIKEEKTGSLQVHLSVPFLFLCDVFSSDLESSTKPSWVSGGVMKFVTVSISRSDT